MRYLGMSALVTVAVCIVASQVSRVGRAQEGGKGGLQRLARLTLRGHVSDLEGRVLQPQP